MKHNFFICQTTHTAEDSVEWAVKSFLCVGIIAWQASCLDTEASVNSCARQYGYSNNCWLDPFAVEWRDNQSLITFAASLIASEGIVVVGACVCLCVCVCLFFSRAVTARASLSAEPRLQARHISLRGEGNALYPVLSSSYFCRISFIRVLSFVTFLISSTVSSTTINLFPDPLFFKINSW